MAGRARAMGTIWLGALVPMPNQVNKKNFINLLKLMIFYFNQIKKR
jgi:hypothetical protein